MSMIPTTTGAAKAVAKALDWDYLDTGAMYRAAAGSRWERAR